MAEETITIGQFKELLQPVLKDVSKLREAVFEGNGEPSLRSQMSASSEAIAAMQERQDKQEQKVEQTQVETRQLISGLYTRIDELKDSFNAKGWASLGGVVMILITIILVALKLYK